MNRALPRIDLEAPDLQRFPDLFHISGKRRNKTNNHSGWKINNERELELLKTVQNVLQSACKSHRQNCVHHCQGSQERNAQRTEFQAFAHGRNEERQHRGKSEGQGHHQESNGIAYKNQFVAAERKQVKQRRREKQQL